MNPIDWAMFERAVRDYELPDFRKYPKVPAVEEHQFPSMIRIYRQTHDRLGRPPLPLHFAEQIAADPSLAQLPRDGVLGRAYRTWPSFVRQEHFRLVLDEHFPLVVESDQLDLRGLDFLIIDQHGIGWGVGLAVATTRSSAWRVVKDGRHQALPVPVLDLYADRHYTVGRLWLHDPKQVEEIDAWIERETARRLATLAGAS